MIQVYLKADTNEDGDLFLMVDKCEDEVSWVGSYAVPIDKIKIPKTAAKGDLFKTTSSLADHRKAGYLVLRNKLIKI